MPREKGKKTNKNLCCAKHRRGWHPNCQSRLLVGGYNPKLFTPFGPRYPENGNRRKEGFEGTEKKRQDTPESLKLNKIRQHF